MRLCDHWNESATAACVERDSVRSMAGVAASDVRPPVDRPGKAKAKRAARAVVKAALWLPRFAVTVLLIPIRGTVGMVSHYKVIEHTIDLLYNDARTAAFIPLVGYQSGFGLNGGWMAFHNDLFGHGERVSASSRYGGRYIQGYQLRFRAQRLLGSPVWADFRGRFEANPGLLFAGFGAPTSGGMFGNDAPQSFYAQDRYLGVFAGGTTHDANGVHFQPGIRGIINHRRFDDPHSRTELEPLSARYDPATLVGFEDGIGSIEMQVLARIDARKYRGLWRRGFWAEAFVGAVRADPDYLHWGTEMMLDVPLWRHTRILSFRLAFEGVTGTPATVPFSELPRLGGVDRLRGYPEDSFRDSYAALGSVEYSYPIHKNISGNLFADVGRVSREFVDAFDPQGMRLGLGGGFLIGSEDSITLRLSAAGGDRFQLYIGTDFAHAFDKRSEQL